MSSIDTSGNVHRPAGSPAGGQFVGRANLAPSRGLTPADVFEFPPLRDGRRAEEIDMHLHWKPNPEGPSIANPAGGVWHLTAYGRPIAEPDQTRTLMPVPIMTIVVGNPPADLQADTDDGGVWRRLSTAPPWLRDHAVNALREPTQVEREMAAGIAQYRDQAQKRYESTGRLPARPVND